jgi:ABC-2 type transport system ATP-binding protein
LAIYAVKNKADVDVLLAKHEEFLTAKSLKKKYLRDLSKETRKVGIIATLISNPEVVILDEPFANLDPTTHSD